jgi:hypothetical protein
LLLFIFLANVHSNDNTALAFKPTVSSNQSSTQILDSYIFVRAWGFQGNGTGQFDNPAGIAIDPVC